MDSMWSPENYKERMAIKSAPLVTKVVKFAENACGNFIKITPSSSAKIMARRYSPDEILQLRSSLPVINGVISKFKNDPDIGMVFKSILISPLLTHQQFVLLPPSPTMRRWPVVMSKLLLIKSPRQTLSIVAALLISSHDHHFNGYGVLSATKWLEDWRLRSR
jgi:hypothetical protein